MYSKKGGECSMLSGDKLSFEIVWTKHIFVLDKLIDADNWSCVVVVASCFLNVAINSMKQVCIATNMIEENQSSSMTKTPGSWMML